MLACLQVANDTRTKKMTAREQAAEYQKSLRERKKRDKLREQKDKEDASKGAYGGCGSCGFHMPHDHVDSSGSHVMPHVRTQTPLLPAWSKPSKGPFQEADLFEDLHP